jgi:hypothetical protein
MLPKNGGVLTVIFFLQFRQVMTEAGPKET